MLFYNRINRFSDIGGDGIYIARGVDDDDIVSVFEQFKRAVIPLADGVYLLRVALENFEIHAPVFYPLVAALRVDIEKMQISGLSMPGQLRFISMTHCLSSPTA